MRRLITILAVLALTSCRTLTPADRQTAPDDGIGRAQQEAFRQGVSEAQADVQRGILGYRDHDIREESDEGFYILLAEDYLLNRKYGIAYRNGEFGPVSAFKDGGYDSVMEPLIAARLGTDWHPRIWKEATAYFHHHRRRVMQLNYRW